MLDFSLLYFTFINWFLHSKKECCSIFSKAWKVKAFTFSSNFSNIKGLSNSESLGAKIGKITIFRIVWITYWIDSNLIYFCVVTIVSDLSYFSHISIIFNSISNKWSSLCVRPSLICHVYYLSDICSEIYLLLHGNSKNINSSLPIISII